MMLIHDANGGGEVVETMLDNCDNLVLGCSVVK